MGNFEIKKANAEKLKSKAREITAKIGTGDFILNVYYGGVRIANTDKFDFSINYFGVIIYCGKEDPITKNKQHFIFGGTYLVINDLLDFFSEQIEKHRALNFHAFLTSHYVSDKKSVSISLTNFIKGININYEDIIQTNNLIEVAFPTDTYINKYFKRINIFDKNETEKVVKDINIMFKKIELELNKYCDKNLIKTSQAIVPFKTKKSATSNGKPRREKELAR